ncbi:MAG: hypothetical protein KC944_21765 [Candidatus Omnitrophica bacterium]|nr:hypothetical protein [Candidatus Omnitrophota bacterium]
MSKSPWFPFFGDDFYMDTLTLSDAAVGFYMRLLIAQWRCERSSDRLPKEHAITNANWDAVAQFWHTETHEGRDYIFNPRMREIVREILEKSAKNSENARKRWDRSSEPDANAQPNGQAVAMRRDMPSTSTSTFKNKSSQEGHGRSRAGREKFVGDLAGDPAMWKSFPKTPDECGYYPIVSPCPDLDLIHRGQLRGKYTDHPEGLEGQLCHRLYWRKVTNASVVLVTYASEAWVDDEDERRVLKKYLESVKYDPWAAICYTTRLTNAERQEEEFLKAHLETR